MTKNNSAQALQTPLLTEEFVRTVAHDMKSKLTSMQAYSQLLHRRITPESTDSLRFLNNIEQQIKLFTEFTTDVTDLLKFTATTCQLQMEPILISEFFETTRRKMTAKNEHLTLRVDIPQGMVMTADKNKIEKALGNISVHKIAETALVHIEAKKTTEHILIAIEKHFISPIALSEKSALEEAKLMVAQEIILLHQGNVRQTNTNKTIIYSISLPLRNTD